MHIAARLGHLEIVRLYITKENIDTLGQMGASMLYGAAIHGHKGIVELLADTGANLNLPGDSGRLPLVEALRGGHVETVKCLINKGALLHIADAYGTTPLHNAAQQGLVEIAGQLIQKSCDALAKDCLMITPFQNAVQSGSSEIFDLFLENLYDGCDEVDCVGSTTLQRASAEGNPYIMRSVLQKSPKTGSSVDQLNESTIHWAAANGRLANVDMLVEHGISPNVPSCMQHTPLWVAAGGRYVEVVEFLLERGSESQINLPSSMYGSTPIIEAAKFGATQCVKLLLDAEADPWMMDVYGFNTFDYARFRPEIFQAVLSYYPNARESHLRGRQSVIQKTITRCLRNLLHQSNDSPAKRLYLRVSELSVLALSLMFFGQRARLRDPIICFSELFHSSPMDRYRYTHVCTFCRRRNSAGNKYECSTCNSTALCEKCYKTLKDGKEKCPPHAVEVIETLEKDMEPLVTTVRQYAPGALILIYYAMYYFKSTVAVLRRIEARYINWEEVSDAEGYYKLIPRPGHDLLKLMAEVGDLLKTEKDEMNFNSKFGKLKRCFEQWKLKFEEYKEKMYFPCRDHQFFEINEKQCEELRHDRQIFTNKDRITERWFREALLHYGSLSDDKELIENQASNAVRRSFTFPTLPERGAVTMQGTREAVQSTAELEQRRRPLRRSTTAPHMGQSASETILVPVRAITDGHIGYKQLSEASSQNGTTALTRNSEQLSNGGSLDATILPIGSVDADSRQRLITGSIMRQSPDSALDIQLFENRLDGAESIPSVTPLDLSVSRSEVGPGVQRSAASAVSPENTGLRRTKRLRDNIKILSEDISMEPKPRKGENYWIVDIEDEGGNMKELPKPKSRYLMIIRYDEENTVEKIVSMALEFADALAPGFAKRYVEQQRDMRKREIELEALRQDAEDRIAQLKHQPKTSPLKLGFDLLFT